MIDRWMRASLERLVRRPFVHILFGARQTGKTTLLDGLLPVPSLKLNLADPVERSRLLADPGLLRGECEALPARRAPHLVLVDEVQAVPSVFDTVQTLYDHDKSRWRFVLCGSSARRLRQAGTNLLPGRSFLHRLMPLVLCERPPLRNRTATWPPPLIPMARAPALRSTFPAADLEERLAFGDLPGVVLLGMADRQRVLRSYVAVHLEEEIRREALVKDWGAFVNFVRLAARESGQIVNHAAISREVGLSQPTVKAHYQLLEDMFVGFHVRAFTGSPRKSLLSTPRFLFFDLGVQLAAGGVVPDINVIRADPGRYLEQWVGIEIWKRLSYRGTGQLNYFRTKDGLEVDYIVDLGSEVLPIEVKWTDRPSSSDAKGLSSFLRDHPRVKRGYVICRCPRPIKLTANVTALPWHCL